MLGDGIANCAGGGSVLAGRGTGLTTPQDARKASQPWGDLLWEDVPETRVNRMVAIVVSFIL